MPEAAGRARELAEVVTDAEESFGVLWALYANSFLAADYRTGHSLADQLVRAGRTGKGAALAAGLQVRGNLLLHEGRLIDAIPALAESIEVGDGTSEDAFARARLAHIPIWARCNVAHALWLAGRAAEARQIVKDALSMADTRGRPFEQVYPRIFIALLEALDENPAETTQAAEEAMDLCRQHVFPMQHVLAGAPLGWAKAATGDAEGISMIDEARRIAEDHRIRMFRSLTVALHARAHLAHGEQQRGLALLDEAITTALEQGEAFHLAEIYRLKALALEGTNGGDGEFWATEAHKVAD